MQEEATGQRVSRGRVALFDTLRGFTIVSMVLFHACYDLAYIAGYPLPWFTGTLFQTIWRASISWTFLLLAGWMTRFSHDNVRRGVRYAAAALLVFVATAIASVDTAVNFGIIFCMAVSTFVFCLIDRPLLQRIPAAAAVVIFVALFALTYEVPHTRYAISGLAWLGLPDPAFSSGDYYPLMPYAFLYLAGASLARLYENGASRRAREPYPASMRRDWCPPLTFLGRHSLLIYLAHQPILLLLVSILPVG